MDETDYALARMDPPEALTIDRLATKDELVLAQSTSQCCRCCCFQQSINWILAEEDNYEPGMNPFAMNESGWIHEESSLFGRCSSWILPGCRAVKYVQHSGQVPGALKSENDTCCTIQGTEFTNGMTESDRHENIVATHEKVSTCGYCFNFGVTFPVCNCFPLPYLETKRSDGTSVGKTLYICDACCFVPKFDVFDENGHRKYRIKPDTCVFGMCVMCRCGQEKGKCCRIPFIVRDPSTMEPITGNTNSDNKAMVDTLWTGWANECCRLRNAYHLVFPDNMSVEDKLLLTGSGILIDLTIYEQQQDD